MNPFFAWMAEHRAQLVPPLLGFVALYLLLPRDHRLLRPVGLAFGLVALVAAGFNLQPPGATLHGVLFYVFSGTAIVAAVSTVTNHNPVYSALSFALATLAVCGLFLLRGAQFLAAATIIIYAGAIVVMFLFIIMLARQSGNASYDRRAREPFLSTLAAFVLLGAILFAIEHWVFTRSTRPLLVAGPGRVVETITNPVMVAGLVVRGPAGFVPLPAGTNPHPYSKIVPGETSRLRGLGRTLFGDYLIAVELAGTLLLVAGVGAVAIAPRRIREKP